MRVEGPQQRAAVAPDPKLLAAAKGFEQSLIAELAKQLERTASVMGDDSPMGAYAGLLPDTLAQAIADAGGLGLAEELARSMEARS